MHRYAGAIAALLLAGWGTAEAKIQTKAITYEQDGTPLQGFLAWDDRVKDKRPGVVVVHEWWGHNQHARNQAIRLAKEGYVGFALDMYGQGKVATHPKDAQTFVQEATKDPAVTKARFDAAVAALKAQPQVNAEEIGAVGYCFDQFLHRFGFMPASHWVVGIGKINERRAGFFGQRDQRVRIFMIIAIGCHN